MIRDFFVQINSHRNNNSSRVALNYFRELFPNAVNDIIGDGGFVLVFSKDQTTDVEKSIKCPRRNTNIYISGEYTFPDMTKDTSVNMTDSQNLYLLFDKYGESIFEKLSGNFIVLIHYCTSNVIKVINSKLALYSLYYYRLDNQLFLSTRLGLFQEIFSSRNINYGVLMQYCIYNYPVSSSTFIKNVFLLPAASILTYKSNSLSISKYWSIKDEFNKKTRFKSIKQSEIMLDEVLHNTIGTKCNQHNKVGISLTGGWDGRLILAYALNYLKHDQILLYSHGTKDNPDVEIPTSTANKLKYNYLPVLLTDSDYVMNQSKWVEETVKYADGLRQISRLHYLYNMSVLKKENGIDFIISGIGGSNLLKCTNYKACDVFNKFVIELIETNNIEVTLKMHYNLIMSHHSSFFNNIDFDEFIASFDLDAFKDLHQNQNKTKRFIIFLISEIERRYFGPELQSYRHLITNYSPFFDDKFITTLSNTVFFDHASNNGLSKSYYISLLYARLTTKNNRELAKEPTDRGFSMYDVANPFMFPVMLYKYFNKRLGRPFAPDYFNNKVFIQNYLNEQCPGLSEEQKSFESNRLFIENYITAMSFLKTDFKL